MVGIVLKDLDLAALRQGLPAAGLEAGDVGTVVFVHDGGRAYEVEFVTEEGCALAIETLRADQIEPFTGPLNLHERSLVEA